MYIAFFADPFGMPRAWGQAPTRVDAIAIAQIELDAYRDVKRANGDPLATAEFKLTVKDDDGVSEPESWFEVQYSRNGDNDWYSTTDRYDTVKQAQAATDKLRTTRANHAFEYRVVRTTVTKDVQK